jgi:hypothetical protein
MNVVMRFNPLPRFQGQIGLFKQASGEHHRLREPLDSLSLPSHFFCDFGLCGFLLFFFHLGTSLGFLSFGGPFVSLRYQTPRAINGTALLEMPKER